MANPFRALPADEANSQRILVFRIGSLGDTCVAIPALRLLRARYPQAHIRCLTNFPIAGGAKAAPLASVIGQSGLIDDYLEYALGGRSGALTLLGKIRAWSPDLLVYLMPKRRLLQLLRDWLFLSLTGVPKIVGLHFDRDSRQHRLDSRSGERESEAARLLRNLAAFGELDLDLPNNWDLRLQAAEVAAASAFLASWPHCQNFIVAGVGTKLAANDWGEPSWLEWARRVSPAHPQLGLALIGVQGEHARSERLLAAWQGPRVNLCGRFNPRESAEVMRTARIFVGHDSGPMHLAAAVGTPVVAVFSARNAPRTWFPYGPQHRVLYHQTDCYGCGLEVCIERRGECIRAISVEQVVAATNELLWHRPAPAPQPSVESQQAP